MKGKLLSFAAGAVTAVMLVSLPLSALASDGALTLAIHPVRVLVNGELFQPKDAQGNDALVFSADGVTYAPIRALAEAYGLEVGYDAALNLVTVDAPAASAVPMDFASQWTVKKKPVTNYGDESIYTADYRGQLSMTEFKAWWKALDPAYIHAEAEKLAADAQRMEGGRVTMHFSIDGYMLGTAYAFDDLVQSNFRIADTWIK